jgi:hypothetical protein
VNKKRQTRERAKGGERKEGGKGTTKEEGERGEERSKDITQGSHGGGEEQTLSKRKYITKEPQLHGARGQSDPLCSGKEGGNRPILHWNAFS